MSLGTALAILGLAVQLFRWGWKVLSEAGTVEFLGALFGVGVIAAAWAFLGHLYALNSALIGLGILVVIFMAGNTLILMRGLQYQKELVTAKAQTPVVEHDVWVYDAIFFCTTGAWPAHDTERDPNRLGWIANAILYAMKQIRQDAANGRLKIWGWRDHHSEHFYLTGSDYWNVYQIAYMTFLEADPKKLASELALSVRPADPVHFALRTNRATIEALWPTASLASSALIELGKLWESGVHFRARAANTPRDSDGAYIEAVKDKIIDLVSVVSEPETSKFRVLGDFKKEDHPLEVWDDAALLYFSERLRRVREFIDKHTVPTGRHRG